MQTIILSKEKKTPLIVILTGVSHTAEYARFEAGNAGVDSFEEKQTKNKRPSIQTEQFYKQIYCLLKCNGHLLYVLALQ